MAQKFKETYTGFGNCHICGKPRALRQWSKSWMCRRCWESGERPAADAYTSDPDVVSVEASGDGVTLKAESPWESLVIVYPFIGIVKVVPSKPVAPIKVTWTKETK